VLGCPSSLRRGLAHAGPEVDGHDHFSGGQQDLALLVSGAGSDTVQGADHGLLQNHSLTCVRGSVQCTHMHVRIQVPLRPCLEVMLPQ
jgi:hypothetical protein